MRGLPLLERVRGRLATEPGEPTGARVAALVHEEAGGLRGADDVLRAVREAVDELAGAGVLEPLLRLADVTDVLVNGPDQVWLDRGAGLERAPVRFPDDEAVRRLAVRLAAPPRRGARDAAPGGGGWGGGGGGPRAGGASRGWGAGRAGPAGGGPAAGARGGAAAPPAAPRLHAVLPPVAGSGTCLSLRVLRRATPDLGALAATGAFPGDSERLLRALVARRRAFLVTGGTGAGKTTLLSALLGLVDPGERLVLCEDAAELAPAHPHVVRLLGRPPNVEGAGLVTLRDLVRQALRMRPDRLVVGEVRGAEVTELLAALNTGHDGGCGTVHVNRAADLPARLEALGEAAGLGRA